MCSIRWRQLLLTARLATTCHTHAACLSEQLTFRHFSCVQGSVVLCKLRSAGRCRVIITPVLPDRHHGLVLTPLQQCGQRCGVVSALLHMSIWSMTDGWAHCYAWPQTSCDSVCDVSFIIVVVGLELHSNAVNHCATFTEKPKNIVFILLLPWCACLFMQMCPLVLINHH